MFTEFCAKRTQDLIITAGETRLTPRPLNDDRRNSSVAIPRVRVSCCVTDAVPPNVSPMRSAMKLFE